MNDKEQTFIEYLANNLKEEVSIIESSSALRKNHYAQLLKFFPNLTLGSLVLKKAGGNSIVIDDVKSLIEQHFL